jgi:hypothetical protein
MCLLRPQSIAQRTQHVKDGFHAQALHGTVTFGGHTKTFFYNSNNHLPIMFTPTDLTKPPTQPCDIPSHVSALHDSQVTTGNLSPLQ